MIDLHAHVLPGVDDGARDLAESLDMLRLAAADGTKILCATPHAFGPTHDVPRASAEAAFATLAAAARAAGIAIELRLAAEAWYRPDLPQLAREGRLPTFSAGGKRYALIEFPPTHVPNEAIARAPRDSAEKKAFPQFPAVPDAEVTRESMRSIQQRVANWWSILMAERRALLQAKGK